MKTIGVIGLGIIGRIWAGHYEAEGVLGGTWNRTPQPDVPRGLPTPEAVTAAVDVTQIVVADPPAVRGVIERILPALGPGKAVVQSSTIDPRSSDEFRARVQARGARYIEAPFTGSKPFAEQRQLVFYVGGDAGDIAAVEPLLERLSATRMRIGTNAQAAALKLAMNLNLAVQMQALSEALTLARRAGIGDDVFFGAIAKNASYSGLTKTKESKLRTGDFSPQFSVKHMLKDVRLAAATSGDAAMPALRTAIACLAAAEGAGFGNDDYSSLIRLLQTGPRAQR